MVNRKSIYEKFAMLIAITSMSLSLVACGNTTNDKESQSSNNNANLENVIESTNDNYKQEELSEDEKTPVYTYSNDKYYHLTTACKGEDEEAMTLLKKPAENCGYLPCPKCAGGTENNSTGEKKTSN